MIAVLIMLAIACVLCAVTLVTLYKTNPFNITCLISQVGMIFSGVAFAFILLICVISVKRTELVKRIEPTITYEIPSHIDKFGYNTSVVHYNETGKLVYIRTFKNNAKYFDATNLLMQVDSGGNMIGVTINRYKVVFK